MRIHHLLAIALSLPMVACAMEVTGDEEPDLETSEIIAFNRLTTEAIVLNSLTGTADAINDLIANPLANDTFAADGPIPDALNDPNARSFFTYLTQCALTGSQAVTYTTFDDHTYTVRGRHGLCPAWADGPPSQACREIVSACILTRNNALGDEVRLSMLGKNLSGAALATSATVPVKTTTISGTAIASFQACKVQQNGPSRNCGFSSTQSLVGTCSPGTDVTLSCKVGSNEIAARVCDGPDGCNHLSSLNLLEDSVCGAQAPSTIFTCGDDGAFSVMIGPVTSGQAVTGGFASATGGVFPASERQIFSIEEGSFYGNLFVPGEHNSMVSRTVDGAGVVTTNFPNAPGIDLDTYGDAFACHDPNWTDGMAYMSHRLCAIDVTDSNGDTTNLCAARKLGACVGGVAPKCSTGDAGPVIGDGDNGGCKDEVNLVRPYPLTTRLHQPCDLIPYGLEAVCERRDTVR